METKEARLKVLIHGLRNRAESYTNLAAQAAHNPEEQALYLTEAKEWSDLADEYAAIADGMVVP